MDFISKFNLESRKLIVLIFIHNVLFVASVVTLVVLSIQYPDNYLIRLLEPIATISSSSSLPILIYNALLDPLIFLFILKRKSKYEKTFDFIRDLMRKYEITLALNQLEKLQRDKWVELSQIEKGKCLLLMGVCKIVLEEVNEGALLYISALKYNSTDEKYLAKAAHAYYLLNDLINAKKYVNQTLKSNPYNILANCINILFSKELPLDEVIEKIPTGIREKPEINSILANIAAEKGLLDRSIEFYETVIKNDREDNPQWKAEVAHLLFTKANPEFTTLRPIISKKAKEELKKAAEMYTLAWNRLSDNNLKKKYSHWIINRGVINLVLGKMEEVKDDISIVHNFDPDNPVNLKNKAGILAEEGKFPEAINILERIDSVELGVIDVPIFIAELLAQLGNFQRAIDKLLQYLEEELPRKYEIQANRLLVRLYIKNQEANKAIELIDSQLDLDPLNVLYLIEKSKIHNDLGNTKEAINILKEILSEISAETSIKELIELGDSLLSFNLFSEAARVYEKIPNVTSNKILALNLLISNYNSGDDFKSYKLCKIIRETHGLIKEALEIEIDILNHIGDLNTAEEYITQYLKLYPDDPEFKLKLAYLYYRMGKVFVLDDILKEGLDYKSLSFNSSISVAKLLAVNNQTHEGFEIMYNLVKRYFNDSRSHLEYFHFYLQNEKKTDEILKQPDKIQLNSAFCIKDSYSTEKWYVITEDNEINVALGEISLKNPLVEQILGNEIGFEVSLSKKSYLPSTGQITHISNKYSYLHGIVIENIKKFFPEVEEVQKIPIDLTDIVKSISDILRPIHDDQIKFFEIVENQYINGKRTIGSLSYSYKLNTMEIWRSLIQNERLGIRCNLKKKEDFLSFTQNLRLFEKKIIMDLISILTINTLDIDNIVSRKSFDLYIVQTTLDEIKNYLYQLEGLKLEGYKRTGFIENKLIIHEITPEMIKDEIEFCNKLLIWIQNNCRIIPCFPILKINRFNKMNMNKLGESYIDTLIIAVEEDFILFSDDIVLRELYEKMKKSEGIWTQAVMNFCLDNDLMNETLYKLKTEKLKELNYQHTISN